MSLQYLLDGYNIIHQMPLNASDSLNDQRNALIGFIEKNHPQGSHKNEVTIYFDGKPGRDTPKQTAGIYSVFTMEASADDMIIGKVGSVNNPKMMVVVTDDRAIQYNVRAKGAKIVKVKDLLKARHKSSADSNDVVQGKKSIPKSVERAINDELKDIWGKKD